MKPLPYLVLAASATLLMLGAGCSGAGDDSALVAPAPTQSTPDQGDGGQAGAGELGRYTTDQGLTRVYVLVDPDITDDALVDLARSLHDAEPEVAEFFFMDDDSRIDDVLAALPETERGDRSNWPADWVVDHTVAHLALFFSPEPPTRQWVLDRGLYPDPQDGLAVFE